jgi:diguanylate cyclase (GGDEF)-like protein
MTQVGQTGRFATTVGPARDLTRTQALPPLPPASTNVQVGFMVVLGLFGWAGLLLAFFLPGFAPHQPQLGGLVPFALFLLVVVATRSMAFRLFSEAVVSLDSAFYIAAALCLGSVATGWLVAVALTVDAVMRLARREVSVTPKRDPRTWAGNVAHTFYFGGMTGALLMLTGWLLGVDGRHLVGNPDAQPTLVWLVPVFGIVFILLHYLIQSAQLRLQGYSLRVLIAQMALPGTVAEATLLPLAVVIVLIYNPNDLLAFILLGTTYLLINFVFSRLSDTGAKLRQRVSELETLNRTAHVLAHSLQLHQLVESISRETAAAIPEATVLAIGLWDEKKREFVFDVYSRERDSFERIVLPRNEGISWWVVENKKPLAIPDLRKANDRFDFGVRGDPGIRAWLGVPLIMYDEVIGVLSVQSHQAAAFGPDHLRLLEAIGGQAAVAIQNARLYELATVDGLTGLYVRRYFDSRLREELLRAQRFGTAFSVVIMDLDDFKALNDTYGHPVGDRVLREIAHVIKRNMRGIDIAARYGGEEFAFILPRTGLVDAHGVAERIRADIADHRVVLTDQTVVRVTASLGVAGFPESGEGDAAAIVSRADVALYRAKSTGKNRVEIFWAETGEVLPQRPRTQIRER